MASIQDSLGRIIEIADATSQQLKDEMRKFLKANVGEAKPFGTTKDTQEEILKTTEKQNDILKDIQNSLSNLNANFNKERNESKQYAEAVIAAKQEKETGGKTTTKTGFAKAISEMGSHASARSQRIEKHMNTSGKHMATSLKTIAQSISEFTSAALKKGSIYVHDISTEKAVKEGFEKAAGVGGGSAAAASVAGAVGDAAGGTIKTIDKVGGLLKNKAASILTGISTAMLGGFDTFQIAFAGAISKEIEFMQNMRAIAFQTQAITGDMNELQRQFSEIGKTVRETGVNRTVFQEEYVKNLKKGIKTQEEAFTVTKAGLNLSTMIGSDAEQTAGLYHDWHIQLGLSSTQMADIALGAQETARWTGVTGDNLLEAVKSSQKIAENMRNAGTLSAMAAKNIIGLSAAAQKLGIADQMSTILTAASSSSELIMNASEETKRFLFSAAAQVGKISDLQNGTLLKTREGIKSLGQGVDRLIRQFGYSIEDIGNLTPEQLMPLNLQLQAAFGLEAGEVERLFESLAEQGKTFSERMTNVNQELKNQNLTVQERLQLEEKLRKIQETAGFEVLTEFSEAAKATDITNLSDAMNKLRKEGGVLTDSMLQDLQQMGVDLSSPTKALEGTLMMTAQQLQKAGSELDFTADIKSAIGGGKIEEVRDVIARMQQEQRVVGKEQAKKLDPITRSADLLTEINDTIRKYVGSALQRFLDIIGAIGILGIQLTSIAISAGMILSTLQGMAFKDMIAGGVANAMSMMGRVGGAIGRAGGLAMQGMGAVGGKIAELLGGGVGTGGGISNILSNAGMVLIDIFSSLKGMGISGIFGSIVGGLKNLGSIAGGAIKSVGKLGGVLGKLAWPIALITGAISGLIGGFKSAANAAEIYGVEQEKVTLLQKGTAGVAGFLTGIINFITFGFFDKVFGPTGSVTKILAKFLYFINPFRVLFQMISNFFAKVKEGFMALWGSIKTAYNTIIQPFKDAWVEIKAAFQPVFDMFSGIIQWFKELFNISGSFDVSGISIFGSIIKGALVMLGKFIEGIATVVAFFIKGFLKPIVAGFKAIATGIMNFVSIISAPFIELWQAFTPIIELVKKGIAWFKKLFNFGEKTGGVFQGIGKIFAIIGGQLGEKVGFFLKLAAKGLEAIAYVIAFWIRLALKPLMWILKGLTAAVEKMKQLFKDSIIAIKKWGITFLEFMFPKTTFAIQWGKTLVENITSGLMSGFKYLMAQLAKIPLLGRFFKSMIKEEEPIEKAKKKQITKDQMNEVAKRAVDAGGGGRVAVPRGNRAGIPPILTEEALRRGATRGEAAAIHDALYEEAARNVHAETLNNQAEAAREINAVQPGRMQPLPITDVHERIARERAETAPSKQNNNLTIMADYAQQQVEILKLIQEGQEKVIELLKPSDVVDTVAGVFGDTRTKTAALTSRIYGNWQFGRQQGNASKQVLNDGVV